MIYEYPLSIYPLTLRIGLESEVNIQGYESLDGANAGTQYIEEDLVGSVLITFQEEHNMTASTIAHESFHAAMEVFNHIHETVDYGHQEAFAYLVGYIAKCCDVTRELIYNA